MWRYLGVVGLWVVLIAAPHFRAPGLKVAVAGVAPEIAAPSDDPGEPFNPEAAPEAAPPAPEERAPQAAAGPFATIQFKNAFDKTLNFVEAIVTLDGKELPPVIALGTGQSAVVFAGKVTPGQHVVKVRLRAEDKPRGPFTYMKGYAFNVESDQVMIVPEHGAIVFEIGARRIKGMNIPFDKQIGIAVRTEQVAPPAKLTD